MRAAVVHFGQDVFHRISILRNAGYVVHDCGCIEHLAEVLKSDANIRAVVMSKTKTLALEKAVSLTREHSSAPIILFPGTANAYAISDFALIVPAFTAPAQWLKEIASLTRQREKEN